MSVFTALSNNNLLLNGDFSQNGKDWSFFGDPPARAWVDNGYCIATLGAYAEQKVSLSAGSYRLSLKTNILYFGLGRVELTMQPSGHVETIELGTDHDWKDHERTFTAPTGTEELQVQLIGDKGEVRFDDVKLVPAEDQPDLIKNGDFSEGPKHWRFIGEPPARAWVDNGYCIATLEAYAEQTVSLSTGSYRLSLKTNILYFGLGRVELTMQPSGHIETIELGTDHDWKDQERTFTVPADTKELQVQLIGDKGEVRFDNVSLKRL